MFDAGFWEFTLIAVIVLVVVGPEKMPALVKTAGKYVGKLKNFIANVKADVADEFDTNSIKKQLSLGEDDSILDIVEENIKSSAKEITDSIKDINTDNKNNE